MEQLVPWDELLDPQNDFIESDTIVMEVKLSASKPKGHLPNKRCAISAQTEAKHIKLECGIYHKAFEDQEVSFTTCGHMFCSPSKLLLNDKMLAQHAALISLWIKFFKFICQRKFNLYYFNSLQSIQLD